MTHTSRLSKKKKRKSRGVSQRLRPLRQRHKRLMKVLRSPRPVRPRPRQKLRLRVRKKVKRSNTTMKRITRTTMQAMAITMERMTITTTSRRAMQLNRTRTAKRAKKNLKQMQLVMMSMQITTGRITMANIMKKTRKMGMNQPRN